MPTEGIAYATEQIKTEIASGVEKLKDLSGTLKENFETAQREIRRGVQRGKVAAEERLDETRRTIKSHPMASVAISAGAGLVVGLTLGWLIGSRRK
jgi:ElaB/YqjD/DUF883 family membrane-anchored ribosome-binding protein